MSTLPRIWWIVYWTNEKGEGVTKPGFFRTLISNNPDPEWGLLINTTPILLLPSLVFLSFWKRFLFFLMAASMAYGRPWDRDWIPAAAATYPARQELLTHCRPRWNWHLSRDPTCCSGILNPLPYSGNSLKEIFFFNCRKWVIFLLPSSQIMKLTIVSKWFFVFQHLIRFSALRTQVIFCRSNWETLITGKSTMIIHRCKLCSFSCLMMMMSL